MLRSIVASTALIPLLTPAEPTCDRIGDDVLRIVGSLSAVEGITHLTPQKSCDRWCGRALQHAESPNECCSAAGGELGPDFHGHCRHCIDCFFLCKSDSSGSTGRGVHTTRGDARVPAPLAPGWKFRVGLSIDQRVLRDLGCCYPC